MESIGYYLKHPNKFLGGVVVKFSRFFPNDKIYLRIIFRCFMGKNLNLENPKTFSEKLQWLKLYNRKPEYTQMVDKYAVKKYVSDTVGEEYIIPTLGVWDSVDEIDFDSLPDKFVLKTTHAGGGNGVVICKSKAEFNIQQAKSKLRRSMNSNPYLTLREWPYKDVKPCIIAEQYMTDRDGHGLTDYKWFCFDGSPKALFIATDRSVEGEETKFDFFDANFNHLPVINGHPNASREIKKPSCFEEMKQLAAKLSAGHPHVRVDLYDINDKVYFGELTFYHWSGMVPFQPEEWDFILGSWINLPIK